MKPDYSRLSKSQIKEKIAELTKRIMLSYTVAQKEKRENRKRLRKEIARLETELQERQNENRRS